MSASNIDWSEIGQATLDTLAMLGGSMVLTIALGLPQTLAASFDATTLEGAKQSLSLGPVASQEAIKMLGTNGGGFFNANSAHPFENPTALVNFLQMLSILAIPAALCFVFGRIVGDLRQGWAVLAAMTLVFVVAVVAVTAAEQQGNPVLAALGADPAGGNMEGKEVRFGVTASALWATATTAARRTPAC